MKTILSIMLPAIAVFAQPPIAPTNEPTGTAKGTTWEDYNIVQSVETGYRWATIGGDQGMYRSTVNYGNGIRLLSGSFSMTSKDGHGKYFDQVTFTTQGLGNDPYQSALLRIEKNKLYRYDMLWRSTDYFNPALTISNGEHFMNTTRHMQDHDLTLFPQSNFKFLLGYSRNVESGPALTTIQLYDTRGDEYPLFANIHRESNEYRLGADVKLMGFRLNVLHGWEDYKEDSPAALLAPSPGNNPNDLNTLASLRQTEPYHGTSPYWRVGLFHDGSKFWSANGRFTYVAGKRAFAFDQLSSGTDRRGSPVTLQVATFGNADRPAATGNLTISLFPTDRITVTNQTSYANIRMVGNAYYVEYDSGVATTPVLPFQFLGIETIANSTNAMIRLRPWFNIHFGYDYADRRISSIQTQTSVGDTPTATPAPFQQTNQQQAGTLGFRIRPLKPLTISVDGEVGRANHPIYPISDGNFQAFRARAEYKNKKFRSGVFARSDYNTNSNSLTSYASKSRQYGADGSWTALDWFSIDAGYSRLHLNTLGGIDYFIGINSISGESSYYVSNLHTAYLAGHFTILKRVDVYAGYNHVQDVGDGRATATGAGIYSGLPALQAAQTFPIRYLSPQGRLSLRINNKIRWNAGYQYYGYREEFSILQNYRAHTGYSSLSWSF